MYQLHISVDKWNTKERHINSYYRKLTSVQGTRVIGNRFLERGEKRTCPFSSAILLTAIPPPPLL